MRGGATVTEKETDAIEGKLLAEIESLRQELRDRESDLRFEHNGRINAEAQCGRLQAWRDSIPIKSIKQCIAFAYVYDPADNGKSFQVFQWLEEVRGDKR